MATSYTSAAMLFKMVSEFAQLQPDWAEAIRYTTTPDERWDPTLVSERVYGVRDEFLAVMAAAGLDHINTILSERTIVLPTRAQLAAMKAKCGIATRSSERSEELAANPLAR